MIAVNKKKTINKNKKKINHQKKKRSNKRGYFTLSRAFYFDFGVRLFTLVKVVLQRLNNCIENIFHRTFFFSTSQKSITKIFSFDQSELASDTFKTLDTFAKNIFSAIWNDVINKMIKLLCNISTTC